MMLLLYREKMLRENLNTATRSEQMMTNTGTEHSVSSDTPSYIAYVVRSLLLREDSYLHDRAL